MVLSQEELYNTQGGGLKIGFFAILGGVITFVVGLIDGYIRPLSCNRK